MTLKVREDIPSLRTVRLVRELERGLRAASSRSRFRVVHYSIQADHVHLIVEASGSLDPGRGMKAVGARKDHLDAPVPEPGSLALLTLGLSAARAKRA